AAEDDSRAAFARVVHKQSVEYINFNARPLPSHLTQHLDAFRNAEERFLADVLQHGDDQNVEHLFTALDQVEVAVGYGVKRARIDGDGRFHLDRSNKQNFNSSCRRIALQTWKKRRQEPVRNGRPGNSLRNVAQNVQPSSSLLLHSSTKP